MNKIKLIVLLVVMGILFLSVSSCCISQNKEVKMEIVQKVSLDTESLMAIKYDEDYVVKTYLIARWKICISRFTYNKHKYICTLTDFTKCEDIERTKRDQMKKIIEFKTPIEECLKTNPDIILGK